MNFRLSRCTTFAAIAWGLGLAAGAAHAKQVQVSVMVENLAPADSISFAPLQFGFHNGSFDGFDAGQTAGAGIVSIAEGGAGAIWHADFTAAQADATQGTVGGALLPGMTNMGSFMVDTDTNPYFSFASMVVPSNDFFVGNDDPMAYRLFDAEGMQRLGAITLKASQIWDAGSEAFDPAAAAFLVDGMNSLRTPQNGVVSFNFSELAGFDGLTTAPGYVFMSGLSADTEVYRVSFAVTPVPEPGTVALSALGILAIAASRRCFGGFGRPGRHPG